MESLRVCRAPHAWLLFSRKRDRGPIFPGIRQRHVNEAVFLHAPINVLCSAFSGCRSPSVKHPFLEIWFVVALTQVDYAE